MKLDSRIKSLSDILTCFDIEKAKEFIGQKGYFAGDLCNFNDIKLYCPYGILERVIEDTDDAFQDRGILYPFFVPECYLMPAGKKYRPYTLMEFNDKFTVGRPIKYRSKDEAGREHYLMLLGFWLASDKDQTIPYISIGNFKYTLQELFEEYEWQEHYTEDFKPFGVVEDKE